MPWRRQSSISAVGGMELVGEAADVVAELHHLVEQGLEPTRRRRPLAVARRTLGQRGELETEGRKALREVVVELAGEAPQRSRRSRRCSPGAAT